MRIVKALIHLGRLAQLLDGLVVLARGDVSHSHIRVDDQRERIKLLRPFHLRDGFIESPHEPQVPVAIPLMGGRVIRIQFDGPLKFSVGFRQVPIEVEHFSQRGMRFGERLIKLNRFSCRRFRFRVRLLW